MRVSLVVFSLVLIAAIAVTGLVGMAGVPASAQGLRTRMPGGIVPTALPNQRPTLDMGAAQATASALATLAAGSVPAGADATLDALWSYAENPAANPDAIAATAEAYATYAALDYAAIEQDIYTLLNDIPEWWYADTDTDSADLSALLNSWLSDGSASVRWEGDALIATVSYTETGLNALIDAAIVTGMYPVGDVNVDLVPGGAIIDTYGLQTETLLEGNLSFYVLLTPVDGKIEIELVSASLNGRQIPEAKLSDVEMIFEDVATVTATAMSVAYDITYSVDELTITDLDFAAQMTVLGVSAY